MRSRSLRMLIPTVALAALLITPVSSFAVPITIVGNTNGSLATATGDVTFNDATNTLVFTLTNTSPFDARITGVGFDIFTGNVNGFSGANVGSFTFTDGDLGNVPQFNSAVLDFGFITGANFAGGSPNLGIAPSGSLTFTVTGAGFGDGLTSQSIAEDIFVRFQRVGADGEGSDVGVVRVPDVSSSLSLLGLAMAAVVMMRRRARQSQ